MKKFLSILIYFLSFISLTYAQIGSTIGEKRRVSWETVGYNRNPIDNLPNGNYLEIDVPPPTTDPGVNYDNLKNKISEAFSQSNSTDEFIIVQLQEGIYNINATVMIHSDTSDTNQKIIIKGKGANKTSIYYEGNLVLPSSIISVEGSIFSDNRIDIVDYNSISKKITLASSCSYLYENSFIDIRVPNHDQWFNPLGTSNNKDFFGQIVKVESRLSDTEYILEDGIDIVWNVSQNENMTPFIEVFLPIQNIGIEDLKLINDNTNKGEGHNIYFKYAVNSWIKSVESYNSINQHISINQSSSIEVRNCFIHHAQSYSGGGNGYGIILQHRSTNCLIENNVFHHLRHSIVLSNGANRNVIGYNYSRDRQNDDGSNEDIGDLSLHGYYPFANLFESNRCDMIKADKSHGNSGLYNTFFRNHIYTKRIKLVKIDSANILCNESNLELNPYPMVKGSYNFYGYDISSNEEYSHSDWNISLNENTTLSDISYYRYDRPSFIGGNFTWPLIGPRVDVNSNYLSQNIPARNAFFTDCEKVSWIIDKESIINFSNLSSAQYYNWADFDYYYAGNFQFGGNTEKDDKSIVYTASEKIILSEGFKAKPQCNKYVKYRICGTD